MIRISFAEVEQRFRHAVEQFSDEQRAELRDWLIRHGISRGLVEFDLTTAWIYATTLAGCDLLDAELVRRGLVESVPAAGQK